jgi:hypothetical protein
MRSIGEEDSVTSRGVPRLPTTTTSFNSTAASCAAALPARTNEMAALNARA